MDRTAPRHLAALQVLALVAGSAAASLVLLGPAGPAEAFSKKVEKACVGDYKRLCPSYKADSAQLRACMEAKSGEISWDCIQALIDSGEIDKKRVAKK